MQPTRFWPGRGVQTHGLNREALLPLLAHCSTQLKASGSASKRRAKNPGSGAAIPSRSLYGRRGVPPQEVRNYLTVHPLVTLRT